MYNYNTTTSQFGDLCEECAAEERWVYMFMLGEEDTVC